MGSAQLTADAHQEHWCKSWETAGENLYSPSSKVRNKTNGALISF